MTLDLTPIPHKYSRDVIVSPSRYEWARQRYPRRHVYWATHIPDGMLCYYSITYRLRWVWIDERSVWETDYEHMRMKRLR